MLGKKVFGAIFAALLAVPLFPVGGVEPQQSANGAQRAGEPRSRDNGQPRQEGGRAAQRADIQQEGTEEGMPAVRPDFSPERGRFRPGPRWRLGVRAYNTTTGVAITFVVPRTPAHRARLEPGDKIVSVDGYQVGYVNDRVYYLGEELQSQAGRDGRVTLLVQNWRDRRLVNVDVRLMRASRNQIPGRPATNERREIQTESPPQTSKQP